MRLEENEALPMKVSMIVEELAYAWRGLRKSPAFVLTAAVTLALAIGANTAVFAVVSAVLLKALPYPESSRLMLASGAATPARFAETQGETQFADFGAYTRLENVVMTGAREPEVLKAVHVSGNFLSILRVSPLVGRSFRTDEDSAGGPRAAMISAELWRRRFGGRTDIAGRRVAIASLPYTIVGVLPERFAFPSPGIDVWMTAPAYLDNVPPKLRALSPFLSMFGRLREGWNAGRANAAMRVLRSQYARAHPGMLDAKAKKPLDLVLLKDELVGNVRTMLWTLMGAVGCVLLIACANLATLMLTRAWSRDTEFALRSALGAGRGRLVLGMLLESVSVAVMGGILGILTAAICLRVIPGIVEVVLPRAGEIRFDWGVLGFGVALSAVTAMLFGLIPAWAIATPDLMKMLRAPGETMSMRMPRRVLGFRTQAGGFADGRGLLSVVQVALSVVLLIGAALLIRSVAALRSIDVGFEASNLLTVPVDLPPVRYSGDEQVARFFREVREELERAPGVRSTAVAMTVPMMDYPGIPIQDAARPVLPLNERMIAKWYPVSSGYFGTMGIRLRRGRDFSAHDRKDSQRVAVIDESLAKRLWPDYPAGVDPVGQHLLVGGANPKPAEIIGVVTDVKQNLDGREGWKESVYVAFEQVPLPNAVVVARGSKDAAALTGSVRRAVRSVDKDQAIGTAETMEARMEDELGQRRLVLLVLESFGVMAVVLALVGIYGTVTYALEQRTRELGIRRALGAQKGDVVRLLLSQGIVLTSVGIAAGVGAAVGLTRWLDSLLFGVSATDTVTFATVALLFFAAATLATYLPAWRATKIDPLLAIRG